jgi:hypothetical protein
MVDGIFKEREHAMEATYFHAHDAKLIDALRQKSNLDGISTALAKKLAIDRPDLLQRVREFGVTALTAAAFLLMPLIEVAWADGSVNRWTRAAVLESARAGGIPVDSPAYRQLLDWLEVRPANIVFATALEIIACGIAVLKPQDRTDRINSICDACSGVAAASRSRLRQILGLASRTSKAEAATLCTIAAALKGRPLSS